MAHYAYRSGTLPARHLYLSVSYRLFPMGSAFFDKTAFFAYTKDSHSRCVSVPSSEPVDIYMVTGKVTAKAKGSAWQA